MLLAIDTTNSACSCALYKNALLGSSEHIEEKGHAELLTPQIEKLLSDVGHEINEVKQIVVTTGPGSFTGVRVGIAAARGLALALNCQLFGITSFEAMAATVMNSAGEKNFPLKNGDKFIIVFDARRGQVYVQNFIFEEENKAPSIVSKPEALDIAVAKKTFAKSGAAIIGSGASLIGESDSFFKEPDFEHILARNFCAYATIFNMYENQKPPTPLYLRAPDAKPSFSFLTKGF